MLKFEFTEQEANYILAALGARPHNEVRSLMDNIVAQAKPQLPGALPEVSAPVTLGTAQPQPTECAV